MTQTTVNEAVVAIAATPVATQHTRVRTPWSEFWRKFKKQHVAMGALVFVLLLVLLALLAPVIAPYDAENFFDYDNLNAGPSWLHWLGVDPKSLPGWNRACDS